MKDQAVVELLKQQIEALGVELYLAEHDPQPGRLLADKVSEAIGRSDAVVVLLTANGAAAPFVQQEIGIARQAGKLIVPIVQEGIDGNALAMLAGVERIEVDFTNPAEALATVTAKLQPLVQAQAEKMAAKPGAPAGQPNLLPVLAGVGLILVILLIAFSDSKS
jgi:hypothetical protein